MELSAAAGQIEIFKWLKYGEKVLSSKGRSSITRLYFKCSHGVNAEKGRAGFLCPARKIVDVHNPMVSSLKSQADEGNETASMKGAESSVSSPSSSTSASSAGEAPSPSSPGHTTTTYRHSHNHQTLASSWVSPRRVAAGRGTATPAASLSAAQLHPPAGTAASLAGQKRRFSSLASTCDGLAVAATAAPLPVSGSAAWKSQTSEVASVGGGSPVVNCIAVAALPVTRLPDQCLHAPAQSMCAQIGAVSCGAISTGTCGGMRVPTSGAISARTCGAFVPSPHAPRPAVTMHLPVESAAIGETIIRSESTGASSRMLASPSLSQAAASPTIPSDSSKISCERPAMISKSSPAPAALPQAPFSAAAASELWTLARSASQSSAVTHHQPPAGVAAGASSGAGAAPTASGSTTTPTTIPTGSVAALLCSAAAMAPGNHGANASSSLDGKLLAPAAAHWIPCAQARHAMSIGCIPLSNPWIETATGSPGKIIRLGVTEHLRRFQSGSAEVLSIAHGVFGVDQHMPSLGLDEESTLKCAPPVDLELRLSLG